MSEVLGPESDAEEERAIPDAAGASSASMEKVGPFMSLRIRNFRLLLVGTVLSNAGQWIQQIALNWLVYNLTGAPAQFWEPSTWFGLHHHWA
jgi:hypothetical protein